MLNLVEKNKILENQRTTACDCEIDVIFEIVLTTLFALITVTFAARLFYKDAFQTC